MNKSMKFIFLSAMLCLAMLAAASQAAPNTASGDEESDKAALVSMLVNEARRAEVDPELVLAVAKVESDFDPLALSHAGARGLMQILPRTGKQLFGVEAPALYEPETNVRLGVAYLRQLLDTYHGQTDIALSHYNGGSGVRLADGQLRVIPATRKYVAKVQRYRALFRLQAPAYSADLPLETQAERYKTLKLTGGAKAAAPTPAVVRTAVDKPEHAPSLTTLSPARRGRIDSGAGAALDDFADPDSMLMKKMARLPQPAVPASDTTRAAVRDHAAERLAVLTPRRQQVVSQLRQLQARNESRELVPQVASSEQP